MIYTDLNDFLSASTSNKLWSFLSIDVGKKKIGVAHSSSSVNVVLPISLLTHRTQPLQIDAIYNIVLERKITGIIIGLPIEMSGNHGPQVKSVTDFAHRLSKKVTTPIYLSDERMTTAFANRLLSLNNVSRKKRNDIDDQLSAAIILENLLHIAKPYLQYEK